MTSPLTMLTLLAIVSLALVSTTNAVTHKDLLGTWKGANAGRPDQAIYSRFGLRSFVSASEGANGITIFGTFNLADKGDIIYCEYAFANFNMSLPQSISLFVTLDETTNTVRLHNDTLSIDISYTRQGDLPLNGIYQNTQLPQTALFEGNIFLAVQAPITTSTPPQDGQVYLGAIVYDDKVANVSECVTTPGAGVPSGTTFINEPYKFSPGRIDFFNTSFLTSGVNPLSSPIEGVWEAENNGCWMTVEFQASVFRILRTGCGANENTLFLGGAVYGGADQSVVLTYSFAYSYSGKTVPAVMNKVGNFKYQLLASGTQLHITGTFAQTQPVDLKLQRVSL